MGRVVFLEVLDRRGHARERFRIDHLPASVGRAYTNAVILDDPRVSAEHLRLSAPSEGSILVEDLDTVNGMYVAASPRRVPSVLVQPQGEVRVRIGNTPLRIRTDDFPVSAAVPEAGWSDRARRTVSRPGIALAVFLLAFGCRLLSSFLESGKRDWTADLVGGSVPLLLGFLIWAGFWSLMNRIVDQSFRFLGHLAVAGAGSLAWLLLGTGGEYVGFVLAMPALTRALEPASMAMAGALLLYGHLSVVSAPSPRRRLLSALVFGAVLLGANGLFEYMKHSEFSSRPEFSAVLKPVAARWLRTEPAEAFFGQLPRLKAEVDEIASREDEKAKKKRPPAASR